MHKERILLHIIERDKVTLKWYCRESILDHVRLFRDAVRPDFFFIYDKARPHRNIQVLNVPGSEDINCIQ